MPEYYHQDTRISTEDRYRLRLQHIRDIITRRIDALHFKIKYLIFHDLKKFSAPEIKQLKARGYELKVLYNTLYKISFNQDAMSDPSKPWRGYV